VELMTLDKYYSTCSQETISWLNKRRESEYKWMNDNQWICALFLNDLYRGFHHVYGIIRESGKNGITINTHFHKMATCDFDDLTRSVIMAHNWGVRFEISSSGPGMLKYYIHKRSCREGGISKRHPTIEQSIERYKDI